MIASGKGGGEGRGRDKGRPNPHCVGGLIQELSAPTRGREMGGRVGSEVVACGTSKTSVSVSAEAQ
jgi:hypothetical protein